jgi:transcriptional regulator with XRE-family HTH domain
MKQKRSGTVTRKFRYAEHREDLQRVRKQAGLSLAELGAMTKLSESSLSRFESGQRGLSPAAFNRVLEAISDVRSGKRAAEQLTALRKMKLSSLLGAKSTEDAFTPFAMFKSLGLDKTPLQEAQEQVKKLEELVAGYQKLNKTYEQIIALLKEEGPGSVAWASVGLLERVEKLTAENAELREWLNAEELAAVSHDKAAELRERVSVAGMRKENAEEEES